MLFEVLDCQTATCTNWKQFSCWNFNWLLHKAWVCHEVMACRPQILLYLWEGHSVQFSTLKKYVKKHLLHEKGNLFEAKLALVVSSYPRYTDILIYLLPVIALPDDTLRDRDSPGGTSIQRRCCSWTFYWFESIFADVVWLSRCWKSCVFWVFRQTNWWPPRFDLHESWQDSSKTHGTTFKENSIAQTIDNVRCLLVPSIIYSYLVLLPNSWLKQNRMNRALGRFFFLSGCGGSCLDAGPWLRHFCPGSVVET